MEWGVASEQDFLNKWMKQALWNDPVGHGGCNDIFDYLMKKVSSVVMTVKKPGHNGWQFRGANGGQCIACLVWANGTHEQSTTLTTPHVGEQWWPCIVLNIAPTPDGKVPFYCPALAWQNARPWDVHISRVRRVGRCLALTGG